MADISTFYEWIKRQELRLATLKGNMEQCRRTYEDYAKELASVRQEVDLGLLFLEFQKMQLPVLDAKGSASQKM